MFDANDLLGANPRRKFEQLLAKRCAARDPFALMLVDLDGFKSVTAEHGANVTDLLLFEVTSRLRQTMRTPSSASPPLWPPGLNSNLHSIGSSPS